MAKAHKTVTNYLQTQLKALKKADAAMSNGTPGAIHKARVACRKSRSVLQSSRKMWRKSDAHVVRAAQEACKKYAQQLSGARDVEALVELVQEWAEQHQWDERSVNSVLRTLESSTTPASDVPAETEPPTLLTAADVIAHIEEVIALPFPPRSCVAAESGLLLPFDHAAVKVVSQVAFAAGTTEDEHHIEALHDVRKSCKRLRYITEMTKEAIPASAPVAAAAKSVQESLGQLQDHQEMLNRLRGSRTKGAQLVRQQSQVTADNALADLPDRMATVLAALCQPRHA